MAEPKHGEVSYQLAPLLESPSEPVHDAEADARLSNAQREADPAADDYAPNPKTDFLNGLRGLAAVWVFMQHIAPGYFFIVHEPGFGAHGEWYPCRAPFLRLFFSGGDAAVVIFFVLSGYVLSCGPFRKLRNGKAKDMRRGLLSSMIRRPIRLYLPTVATSFITALLLHVPGPLVLPSMALKPKEGGLLEELPYWLSITIDYMSPFHEHNSALWPFPYTAVMWTLPIELKGSFLVFIILGLLSLGIQGPDPQVPLMVSILLFGASTVMLVRNWKWSMACFQFGMVLAMIDTWPLGRETRRAFGQVPIPPVLAKLAAASVKILQMPWNVLSRTAVKQAPFALRKYLPGSEDQAGRTQAEPRTWPYVSFWVGWYLLSQVTHSGEPQWSEDTPGWGWLTRHIPRAYDALHFSRYWTSWGAVLAIYGILRIPLLQRFFNTRLLQFFGHVSFMLYLVHLPLLRITGDRISSLLGNNTDPHLENSFWEKTLTIPDIGPTGFNTRFAVGGSIALYTSLLVARVATKFIDEPSVRLGKRVTTKLGLDRS